MLAIFELILMEASILSNIQMYLIVTDIHVKGISVQRENRSVTLNNRASAV